MKTLAIKNKKSILTTLDDIIRDSKDRIDGMSRERVRESYVKEGFGLVRNKTTEPGIDKQNGLKNSYNSDYNIEVFYASGDWKGIP